MPTMPIEQVGSTLETLLWNNRSYIEDNDLQAKEREFLHLVGDRNLAKLRSLLEKQRNAINVNCCDYRGYRALDIAVSLGDEELVCGLLSICAFDSDHLHRALLKAVDANNIELVKMLFERCQNEEPIDESDKKTIELTPLMSAAINENLEIVRLLIHKGKHIVKPHLPRCACFHCRLCAHKSSETLQDSLSRINAYRALASPIYIVLVSKDPILTAFTLSHETALLAKDFSEHQDIYRQLSEQCAQFAADFLHQCYTTEEVEILLVQKIGLKDTRNHRYSRLCLAVQYKQKRFISHPTCQQVLHSTWVEGLSAWMTLTTKRKVLHVITQIVLTPIVSTVHVLSPRPKIIGPLRVPFNRFIYSVTSYAVFLMFLLATLFWDKRQDIRKPATWPRFVADAWVMGNLLDVIVKIWSIGLSDFLRFWWNKYDLVMHVSFAISESINIFVYVNSYVKAGNVMWNRMELPWYHPLLIGEGIFACASVLAFCRVMMWYQMQSKLGPLGTSLTYMVNDVLRFFMIFFILMFSFTIGINSIYRNYEGSVRVESENDSKVQPDAFISLKSTFKTLFWTSFGMGEAQFADIIVNGNFTNSAVIKHAFTESVGYALWGLYHLLIVIVLLNMLIAMMAETYERVQGNSDMEWKFARCTLWLNYFDNEAIVPSPFNLLPSLRRLAGFVRWIIGISRNLRPSLSSSPGENSVTDKYCNCENTDSINVNDYQEKYEKLLFQLRRRYLDWKRQQDTIAISSALSSSYYEHSEKQK